METLKGSLVATKIKGKKRGLNIQSTEEFQGSEILCMIM